MASNKSVTGAATGIKSAALYAMCQQPDSQIWQLRPDDPLQPLPTLPIL